MTTEPNEKGPPNSSGDGTQHSWPLAVGTRERPSKQSSNRDAPGFQKPWNASRRCTAIQPR